MSLKKIFFKTKLTYKIYLFYNLYIRHKGFQKRTRYSQWGEDQFIIDFFKDKKKGIYFDVGCFHPFMYSNTCLLHNKGWYGVNIDINPTNKTINNKIKTMPPIIPSSSTNIANIKSVWASGRKKLFCKLLPNPTPNQPP